MLFKLLIISVAHIATSYAAEDIALITHFARNAEPQDTPPQAITTSTNAGPETSASSISMLAIPSVSPEQPENQPLLLDLSYEKVEQSISIPFLPQVSFGCKNCTTAGRVELSTGTFDVEPINAISPGDVLQNATVTLSLPDGLTAYIELGLNVSVEVSFEIPIIDLPVAGYTIPNIGKAGLFFSPVVGVSFEASEPIQMGFGFEVEIPKNSLIELDLSSLSNLTKRVVGFNDMTVKALPASLNASIAGSLTTSFQPNIMFGIDLGLKRSFSRASQFQLVAEVNAIVDAPALRFNLTREENLANPSCAPDDNNISTSVSTEVLYGMGVEALIVIPNLEQGIGVVNGDSGGDLNPASTDSPFDFPLPSTSMSLLSKTVTTASTCLGEVKEGVTGAPVVITSATPSPTGEFGAAASPGAKAPSEGAALLEMNVCLTVLSVITMLFICL